MTGRAHNDSPTTMQLVVCTTEQLAALIRAAVRDELDARERGDELLTQRQAAQLLGTTPAALHKMIARGRLKPDQWGGRDGNPKGHRFRRSTINAYMKS